MMKYTVVLLLFIVSVTSNLWDNIFSQMNSNSPIILKQSVSFKFPLQYEDFTFEGTFDFNKQLNVITVTVSKQIFIISMKVFVLQIDLSTYIVEIDQFMQGCSKYTLEGIQQYGFQGFDLDKYEDKIYLINILFQWIKRVNISGKPYEQFMLKPDLLLGHQVSHELYEKNPLVFVSQSGQVFKIYLDDSKQKQIPFNNKSDVIKKLACSKDVQVIKKQQLYALISGLLQERGIDTDDIDKYDFPDIFKP